jgi:hypothetical protein
LHRSDGAADAVSGAALLYRSHDLKYMIAAVAAEFQRRFPASWNGE